VTTILVVGALITAIAVALLVAERLLVSHAPSSVTVNGQKTIPVESGENLLTALNRHKLYVPSACGGKATCGLCKIKVEGGAGSLLPVESIFMTREERAAGMRLACQIKVTGDVRVRLSEAMLAASEYRARVLKVERLSHDTLFIRFRAEDGGFSFKPGQYLQLLVPGTDQFRAYSIASPPSLCPEVELIVRYIPGGLCTGWLHKTLLVGDELTFTGPFGDFYLHEDDSQDLVALGRSTGMAPLRSIIMHLAERNMPRAVTFFFGARSVRDLYLVDYYRELERRFPNFRFIPSLSKPRPEDNWTGEVGYPAQILRRHVPDCSNRTAVLCGPPVMIDQALTVLPQLGFLPEHIYCDRF
jgi:Na+-transporting NADH:ubiquinone oxidoreductase subunit F